MYTVTVRKNDGQFRQFETPTLPEQKTGAFQETIQADKHYYYVLADGTEIEYRTPDAAKPSLFAPPPVTVPPVVVPPNPAGVQFFSPTAFPNTTLISNAKLRADSPQLVAYLVGASKDKASGGTSVYFPNLSITAYNTPIFYVSDATIPKTKIQVKQGATVLTYTELHKELQSVGHRIPADFAGAAGTDGACVVVDTIDKTAFEAWQYRVDGGLPTISWGTIVKDLPNHPGFIATLPNGEKQGSRASGIPLLVGVIRFQSFKDGVHKGPLALTLPDCLRDAVAPDVPWLAPAQRTDGWDNNPSIVKMGTLFRLPASYVVPATVIPAMKVILTALRDYGCYVIDTSGGSNLGFTAENINHLAPPPPASLPMVDDGHGGKRQLAAAEWPDYWANGQYNLFLTDSSGVVQPAWKFLQLTSRGGQMPWDLLQAVQFPVVAG